MGGLLRGDVMRALGNLQGLCNPSGPRMGGSNGKPLKPTAIEATNHLCHNGTIRRKRGIINLFQLTSKASLSRGIGIRFGNKVVILRPTKARGFD